jgi:MFS family permease
LPKNSSDTVRLDPLVWKITAVAALGSFLAQLDATIVNVSLSSLAVDLHSSLTAIQWVTSGYLLALALMLPLNGWLVERIGAKSLYLWCFSAFTLSSALCGLSWSANSLIGFRILQGMSGGLPLRQYAASQCRVPGAYKRGRKTGREPSRKHTGGSVHHQCRRFQSAQLRPDFV